MNLSIVIPLLNEEESLIELHDWIATVMRSNRFSYEILFIDDGSSDGSWHLIKALSIENPEVKGIRFQKNYGKSQALHAGFKAAEGEVIITMDADLQDNPEEIPELYTMIKEGGYDLVSGWKKKTIRFGGFKEHALKTVQLGGTKDFRGTLERLQLRPKGLSKYGGEVDRSLGRNAPIHSRFGKECGFCQYW